VALKKEETNTKSAITTVAPNSNSPDDDDENYLGLGLLGVALLSVAGVLIILFILTGITTRASPQRSRSMAGPHNWDVNKQGVPTRRNGSPVQRNSYFDVEPVHPEALRVLYAEDQNHLDRNYINPLHQSNNLPTNASPQHSSIHGRLSSEPVWPWSYTSEHRQTDRFGNIR